MTTNLVGVLRDIEQYLSADCERAKIEAAINVLSASTLRAGSYPREVTNDLFVLIEQLSALASSGGRSADVSSVSSASARVLALLTDDGSIDEQSDVGFEGDERWADDDLLDIDDSDLDVGAGAMKMERAALDLSMPPLPPSVATDSLRPDACIAFFEEALRAESVVVGACRGLAEEFSAHRALDEILRSVVAVARNARRAGISADAIAVLDRLESIVDRARDHVPFSDDSLGTLVRDVFSVIAQWGREIEAWLTGLKAAPVEPPEGVGPHWFSTFGSMFGVERPEGVSDEEDVSAHIEPSQEPDPRPVQGYSPYMPIEESRSGGGFHRDMPMPGYFVPPAINVEVNVAVNANKAEESTVKVAADKAGAISSSISAEPAVASALLAPAEADSGEGSRVEQITIADLGDEEEAVIRIGDLTIPSWCFDVAVPELQGLAEQIEHGVPLVQEGVLSFAQWGQSAQSMAATASKIHCEQLMSAAEALEFWASIESMQRHVVPEVPASVMALVHYLRGGVDCLARCETPGDPTALIEALPARMGDGPHIAADPMVLLLQNAFCEAAGEIAEQVDIGLRSGRAAKLREPLAELREQARTAGFYEFARAVHDLERRVSQSAMLMPEHRATAKSLLDSLDSLVRKHRGDDQRGVIVHVLRTSFERMLLDAQEALEGAAKIEGVIRGLRAADPQSVEQLLARVGCVNAALASLDRRVREANGVELDQLLDRLQASMDDACRESGVLGYVKADFGGVRVARRMHAQLADALDALVRNAVRDGLETAQGREEAGKEPVGCVSLAASIDSDMLVLDVMDDGRPWAREDGAVFEADGSIARVGALAHRLGGWVEAIASEHRKTGVRLCVPRDVERQRLVSVVLDGERATIPEALIERVQQEGDGEAVLYIRGSSRHVRVSRMETPGAVCLVDVATLAKPLPGVIGAVHWADGALLPVIHPIDYMLDENDD